MGVSVMLLYALTAAPAQTSPLPLVPGIESLPVLRDAPVKLENALWGEVPKERQLLQRKVVVADIPGPAVITMIHFAFPESLKLDRSSVLRMWWDDEKEPSVAAPLVDFFCDPNGTQERVESLLVNKRRGWNAYFPMPFARRALIELEHDGRGPAPCYSYVFYHPLPRWDAALGYFHSTWRQEKLLLGEADYVALEARGRGQFVGWNVTVRGMPPNDGGYPVDENAKFYVDGEAQPSVELMGLEDAFGFSYGFPETANAFPFTGWAPFYKGAFAYRFFINEAIPFQRSLRVAIGFGEREAPFFRERYSKPDYPLEFSSCCYWYQTEPHAPFAPLPSYRLRLPSPDREQQKLLDARSEAARKAGLAIQCYLGDPQREDMYLAEGYDCVLDRGYRFNDTTGLWKDSQVKHCWASWDQLEAHLVLPKGVAGKLRMLFVDGDNFMGGRRQRLFVAGRRIRLLSHFQAGRWIEVELTPQDTATGEVPIRIENAREGANVVMSVVEFKPATGKP